LPPPLLSLLHIVPVQALVLP